MFQENDEASVWFDLILLPPFLVVDKSDDDLACPFFSPSP